MRGGRLTQARSLLPLKLLDLPGVKHTIAVGGKAKDQKCAASLMKGPLARPDPRGVSVPYRLQPPTIAKLKGRETQRRGS